MRLKEGQTLSNHIKVLLALKNMTLSELAEKTNQSPQNLSNKLQKETLRYKEAEEIAKALGMEIEWLG